MLMRIVIVILLYKNNILHTHAHQRAASRRIPYLVGQLGNTVMEAGFAMPLMAGDSEPPTLKLFDAGTLVMY